MDYFVEDVKKHRVVMIYRGLGPEECLAFTEVLKETGIRYFEVTLNTPGAMESIKLMKDRFGSEVSVGAGTVLTAEQVKEVADAGGAYIISPNMNEDVIKTTKQLGLYSIPGAFTPTEIVRACEVGADMVKVFPINVVGAEYIRQLRGPLEDIPFMATGGVKLDMVEGLFKAGTDAIGLGVHLLGKEWVETKNWDELQASAKRFLRAAGYTEGGLAL
ncbi:bifunctional 4-hydroxy-2-oxoglutarate aldolase/2-dehydro-3-deoxy-phosphogluconate aldolase [Paenibacillus cremeus]|nr:bifunctional 4-hydroxy-2-oxoglutarate aldolase/2-dehydro-3-deoxy-phosphogluconate aldolase [Paenibacillus cremeus]